MTLSKFYHIVAIVCALSLSACGHNHADDELSHHHHDHEHGEAHEVGSEISLSPEAAERFGVESDTILPGEFSEVVLVTGQIVDNPSTSSVVSAPTSGIVKYSSGVQQGKTVSAGETIASISAAGISGGDNNQTSLASLNAAKRELDRLTPLYEEGIVSAKDYNAAREAYEIAKSQHSPAAATGAAKTVGSGVITELLVPNGQYVEAGTPIAAVTSNKRLTLRADVPDRYQNTIAAVQNARIRMPHQDTPLDLNTLNGKRVSSAEASMRVHPGYIPVYFSFDNNGQAMTQTLVEVYLLGLPRQGVISVPTEAIVEQQGKYFVFRQIDEDCYEKLPVTLGASDGINTEIKSGLQGGECIVTKGATAVRLAESSAVVPEGHSHNH